MIAPTNNAKLPDKVLVDIEDLPKLSKYNSWFISKRGDVYSQKWYKGKAKTYKIHRVIMDAPDNFDVDHINGNPLDNRKENLRVCTHAENGRNLKKKKNNTSGHVGIIWDKERNKWRASIKVFYKSIYLGRYNKIKDAVAARKLAESKYFGEFAPRRS